MLFRTRKIIMPGHLNGTGSLFGGQALAWIDEEAAIFAACQLGSPKLVTKFMSSIDFRAPARLGDLVEIGCALVRFGTTSIVVECTIRNKTTREDILHVKEMVFVLLDDEGRPQAHGITQITEG